MLLHCGLTKVFLESFLKSNIFWMDHWPFVVYGWHDCGCTTKVRTMYVVDNIMPAFRRNTGTPTSSTLFPILNCRLYFVTLARHAFVSLFFFCKRSLEKLLTQVQFFHLPLLKLRNQSPQIDKFIVSYNIIFIMSYFPYNIFINLYR